jgi:hypothetical protein
MVLPAVAAALIPVAYDVDLLLEAPDAEPVEVHLVDVDEGPLPMFYLPTEDGGYMVDIALKIVGEDQALFDIEIVRKEPGRFGRLKNEVVSRPRITALFGQPAFIQQAKSIPLPDGGFENTEVLKVEATLHE